MMMRVLQCSCCNVVGANNDNNNIHNNNAQRFARKGALRAVRGLAADPLRASFVQVEVAQGRRVQAVRGAVVDLHACTRARMHAYAREGWGHATGCRRRGHNSGIESER